MRVSIIAIAPSIGRRMFMRLPWAQADNVGVVKFMFLLGLDVSAVRFAPSKNPLIDRGQGN